MSEIPKAYEPQSVEDRWYDFWLKQGCFTADPARVTDKRPAYSIVIPPPNVTGVLHMGHVLNNTIQDILARKARMDGKEVLWLPGTDHAGIATEGMVDKQIRREEKKSKRDLGREEFLKRVWAWKEKHGGIIIEQLKKLGCSCDWTRQRFTMDEHYVRCVQKVFVELYKKGLIYRGKRMVNWCPASLTALSDEEVEMKTQKGWLYTFSVDVVDANGKPVTDFDGNWVFLKIATTRPETIPGDAAIAVNPKDVRYTDYIGKFAVRPLPDNIPFSEKLIPIISDEQVEFEFGTGVLKVTPCHDKADFEIAQRHKLPCDREVIGPDGKMTQLAGELAGMDRFQARREAMKLLVELAKKQGGYIGGQTLIRNVSVPNEAVYEHSVGFSQRADVPIEPRLSEQWFLKYPSEAAAMSAVRGRDVIMFRPTHWADVYVHWMFRIQDWCISRQLWWGHRIPVWTQHKWEFPAERIDELLLNLWKWQQEERVVVRSHKEADVPDAGKSLDETRRHESVAVLDPEGRDKKIVHFLEEFGYVQDPDVLDTWFSSWLWPFATMGWPEQTATLKKFYPTTDLVTAPEIIFFWVARMIMAGYEFMGEPKFGLSDAMPFHNVYFTGIIRDKIGRKMSKTLGNSPDPLDLIAKYGADAVRFGTMRSAPLGQDVMFDEKDVELGRNFCNKLWNACRFRQMQGSAGGSPANEGDSPEQSGVEGEIDPALLTSDDKWILLKLDEAIREITDAFAEYKFSDATATLYRFFWSEYCDWYVEASKAVLGSAAGPAAPSGGSPDGTSEARTAVGEPPTATREPRVLPGLRANKLAVIDFVLGHTLRLFHPFMPFITEELWQGMGYSHDLPEDQGGKTIMFARWPKALSDDEKAHYGLDEATLKFVDAKYELVTRGRNLRREFNIPGNKKVKFVLKVKNPLPAQEADVIKLLLNAEALDLDPNFTPGKGAPSTLTDLGELFLPLEGLVDVEAEKVRQTKELAKIEGEIEKVRSKLNNQSFVEKVPPSVLEDHKKRLAEWQAKQQQLKAALSALNAQ